MSSNVDKLINAMKTSKQTGIPLKDAFAMQAKPFVKPSKPSSTPTYTFTKHDPSSGMVAMTTKGEPVYPKEKIIGDVKQSLDDIEVNKQYLYKKSETSPPAVMPGIMAKNIYSQDVKKFEKSMEAYPPGQVFKQTSGGSLVPVVTPKTHGYYENLAIEKEYQEYKREDAFRSWGKIFVGSLNDPISFMGEFGELVYGKITGDEGASKHFFTDYYKKAVAKQKQAVSSPLDFVMYHFESPFVSIPVTVGGIKGLGYLKGLSPTGAKISSGISKAIGLYSAKSIYEGGQEAYRAGTLSDYLFRQGVYLGVTMIAGQSAFKRGETLGIRKSIISQASTPMEKARLRFMFNAIDKTTGLSSKNAMVFDISQTGSLKGNVAQQQAFTRFMRESPYAKKLVLGGSASQSTYLKGGRTPHDIDILVKKSLFGKSRVSDITASMKKYGVDTSLYDIHDMPGWGSSFVQRGTGFSERPIKTPAGSLFKYQMRFSEQAGRKFSSAYSPLHELRGKDWADVIDIASGKMDSATANTLKNYMPQLKPGTYELMGQSYYAKHPGLSPKSQFTFFEKLLRRYHSGVKQSDLFTAEGQSFMKPGADPFRPRLISKPTVPSWGKGIVLFSVAVPVTPSGIAPASNIVSTLGLSLLPSAIKNSIKKKTQNYFYPKNRVKSPVYPYKSTSRIEVFPSYPKGKQPYKPPVTHPYAGSTPYYDTKPASITTKTIAPSIFLSEPKKYAYSPSEQTKDFYPVAKTRRYFEEMIMKPKKQVYINKKTGSYKYLFREFNVKPLDDYIFSKQKAKRLRIW